MKKQNKYEYLYVLQGNYSYGWDDLTQEDKSDPQAWKNIKQTKREYMENEKGVTFRIIERRELKQ